MDPRSVASLASFTLISSSRWSNALRVASVVLRLVFRAIGDSVRREVPVLSTVFIDVSATSLLGMATASS